MKALSALCLLLLLVIFSSIGQTSSFQDTNYASGFGSVNGITFDAVGRCFAWEKEGKVWAKHTDGDWHQLLDLAEEVNTNTDCGLKGFALDPNFLTNGYIYLLYEVEHYHLFHYGLPDYDPNMSEYESASIGRITRYTLDFTSFSILPNSRFVLVGRDKNDGFPMIAETHNVGSLVFGTDGTLLASCGESTHYTPDNGSNPNTYYQQAIADGILTRDDPTTPDLNEDDNVGAWRAQLVNSLNGKIIRIDPATGDGVSSNPFYDASNPRMPKSRVWAMGFRNPFRMSIKPNTGSTNPDDANPGEIFVGDVGLGQKEEVNIVKQGGQNFGWPIYEGMTEDNSPLVPYPENRPEFTNAFNWSHPAVDYRGQGARAYKGGSAVDVTTFNPAFNIIGNCVIGGVFYTGTNFPREYQGAYMIGNFDNGDDYLTENWIHSLSFDSSNELQKLLPLDSTAMGVTCIAENPINGYLYYASYVGSIHEIKYASSNQAPLAKVTQAIHWGVAPLTLTLDASTSTDPDNDSLSYTWDFGDGSPVEAGSNVTHTFNAPDTAVYTVTATVTVTDIHGLSSTATVLISLNNTPPTINSTSVDNIAIFENKTNLQLALEASVQDKESDRSLLSYKWETALHHNTHNHPNPVSNAETSSVILSPVPCDGNLYFYRVKLTVTDPQGLPTVYVKDIYPNCTTEVRDTIAPSVPQNLQLVAKTYHTIHLSWDASTDNVRVAGYQLIAGTDTIWTTQNTYAFENLTAETNYRFVVRAQDASGNWSDFTNALETVTESVPDTIPPSVPQHLTVGSKSETSVQLIWNRASDNRGGVTYQLFRIGGEMLTTSDSILTVTNLLPETVYQFYIRAVDGSGLLSAISDTILVETLPIHPAIVQDEYIYRDNVASAWANITSLAGLTIQEGAGYKIDSFAIKLVSPVQGSRLTFQYLNAPLFTSDFPDGISFWVYNTDSTALPLVFHSFQTSGGGATSKEVSALPRQWTPISIAWNELGTPTRIAKIAIEMNASQGRSLYIDELKLVHCAMMNSVKSGDWNDASVWSCGRVPIATDSVTIRQTDTITVLNGISATMRLLNLLGHLQLESGGIIDMKNY